MNYRHSPMHFIPDQSESDMLSQAIQVKMAAIGSAARTNPLADKIDYPADL